MQTHKIKEYHILKATSVKAANFITKLHFKYKIVIKKSNKHHFLTQKNDV